MNTKKLFIYIYLKKFVVFKYKKYFKISKF